MKTALHSVSYAGVWSGQSVLSLDDFIDKSAKLKFDGVMIMAKRPHASILDLGQDSRKKIRERLKKKQLACACIAGYTDIGMGLEHPDIPVSEMQIAYILELARLAYDLGGNLVRIFTAFERQKIAFHIQWERCVKTLKEAARRANDFGVTLAIQNHHDIGAHYESMYDLIREIDEKNCKVAFDAWAVVLHGDNLVQSVKKLAPYIVHTTVADYVRRPRFSYQPSLVNYHRNDDYVKAVPVGDGIIDYKCFLKTLKETGYKGYVAYEMCSPLAGGGGENNLDYCAAKFLEFMKSFE